MAGGSIFPLIISLFNNSANPENDGPDGDKQPKDSSGDPFIDFAQKAFKYQANTNSDPAYALSQNYRDTIGADIYRAAYQVREETDMIMEFKAFLDVYAGEDAPLFDHKLDVIHLHLTDLTDSLLKIEARSNALATGTLEFIPTSDEFANRYSREPLSEKLDRYHMQRYPEKSHQEHSTHPELAHSPHHLSGKSPEKIVGGLLEYINVVGPLLADRLGSLASALEADLAFIQLGHGKHPVSPENSVTADILQDIRNILSPDKLPRILLLCREAAHTFPPASKASDEAVIEQKARKASHLPPLSDINFSI